MSMSRKHYQSYRDDRSKSYSRSRSRSLHRTRNSHAHNQHDVDSKNKHVQPLEIHRKRSADFSKPKGKAVYVGNLPFSVNNQQLREAFQDYGAILDSVIKLDSRGKSRGWGLITFEKEEDASEAIKAMD